MTRSNRSFALGAREVQAQLIVPTLHPQRWSLDGAAARPMSRVVHLGSGRGELSHHEGELTLREPDVLWLPAGAARSLRVEAGSAGIVVGVSDSLLAASIGEHADAAALRQISGRLCLFTPHEAARREELARSLRAIEAEARSGVDGSWHYLAAHLTLVLVMLWRMAGRGLGAPMPAGQADPRLQHFRHLVEAQFRDHWPITRYADELSISADRLHDLCVRHLQRSPLTLLHQRLVREACLLLAGTNLSVERLAADLGFASASHFSRFFKRWTATSPKAWRLQSRSGGTPPASAVGYADWP